MVFAAAGCWVVVADDENQVDLVAKDFPVAAFASASAGSGNDVPEPPRTQPLRIHQLADDDWAHRKLDYRGEGRRHHLRYLAWVDLEDHPHVGLRGELVHRPNLHNPNHQNRSRILSPHQDRLGGGHYLCGDHRRRLPLLDHCRGAFAAKEGGFLVHRRPMLQDQRREKIRVLVRLTWLLDF